MSLIKAKINGLQERFAWDFSPDRQVVRLAARVAEVADAEPLRQGGHQLLDVLGQDVRDEALGGGQSAHLALTGSYDLKFT